MSGETGKSLDLSMGKHHSLISGSFSGSVEFAGMEEGLRARLKRIAKEINTRDQAHKDMRPPPVSVGVAQLSPIGLVSCLEYCSLSRYLTLPYLTLCNRTHSAVRAGGQ